MATLSPRTLWAQDKHQVFVTFEVFEATEVSVEFEQHKIRFSAVQADTKQKYSVELELFDAVKPEECTESHTPRAIKCSLGKANAGPFWPRLLQSKTKPHFLSVDFSRWLDEDYEEEDPAAGNPMDPSMFMNMAAGNAMGGMPGGMSAHDFEEMQDSDSGPEYEDGDVPKLLD